MDLQRLVHGVFFREVFSAELEWSLEGRETLAGLGFESASRGPFSSDGERALVLSLGGVQVRTSESDVAQQAECP